MALTQTTVGTALQYLVQEEIPKVVDDLLPTEIDEVFEDVITTSEGVRMKDDAGISRKWRVYHTFITGLAGRFKWVDPDAEVVGTLAARKHTISPFPSNNWPTARTAPLKGIFQTALKLSRGYGVIPMPLEINRMTRLTATQRDYVAACIQAVGRNIALQQALAFYVDPSTNVYGTVNSVSSGGTTGSAYAVFSLKTGRINRFWDGMAVDVYSSDYSSKRNSVVCLVDGVDPVSGSVRIVTFDGTNFSSNLASDDVILLADTRGASSNYGGPLGLPGWLIDSGTLFGTHAETGISLSSYPRFKSLVVSGVGALDELTLSRYMSKFAVMYPGVKLDTIVTTAGVIEKFVEAPFLGGYRQVYDRTNRALTIHAGRTEDIKFEAQGRTFKWYASILCETGSMYIFRRQGNITRYTPPVIPGTKTQPSQFGGAIEFVGPALGFNGIWIPVQYSSAASSDTEFTDTVQAPFETFYGVFPTDPRGIKLTGITEAWTEVI